MMRQASEMMKSQAIEIEKQRPEAHESGTFGPIALAFEDAGQIIVEQLLVLGALASIFFDARLVGVEAIGHFQH